MDNIKNEINLFLDDFKKKNISKANDNFLKLLDDLSTVTDKWQQDQKSKPDVTVQISELPLTAANLYP